MNSNDISSYSWQVSCAGDHAGDHAGTCCSKVLKKGVALYSLLNIHFPRMLLRHSAFVTRVCGFPFERGDKMWLRNSFCHVFGSERAISVLARLCHTAVLSASGTCSKRVSVILLYVRQGAAFSCGCQAVMVSLA